jgi:hypothetical protein
MKAIVLGIELAASVATFTYLGFYLDKKFSITVFVIVLPLVALAGSMIRIYYKTKNNF